MVRRRPARAARWTPGEPTGVQSSLAQRCRPTCASRIACFARKRPGPRPPTAPGASRPSCASGGPSSAASSRAPDEPASARRRSMARGMTLEGVDVEADERSARSRAARSTSSASAGSPALPDRTRSRCSTLPRRGCRTGPPPSPDIGRGPAPVFEPLLHTDGPYGANDGGLMAPNSARRLALVPRQASRRGGPASRYSDRPRFSMWPRTSIRSGFSSRRVSLAACGIDGRHDLGLEQDREKPSARSVGVVGSRCMTPGRAVPLHSLRSRSTDERGLARRALNRPAEAAARPWQSC